MTDTFDIKLYFTTHNNLISKTFKIEKNTSIQDFIIMFDIQGIVKMKDFDVGVFGKIKNFDYIIKPNDRLELYRKIIADPKIRRKNIAKSNS